MNNKKYLTKTDWVTAVRFIRQHNHGTQYLVKHLGITHDQADKAMQINEAAKRWLIEGCSVNALAQLSGISNAWADLATHVSLQLFREEKQEAAAREAYNADSLVHEARAIINLSRFDKVK